MPTNHRKQMVKAGYAPAHHGHDKAAVALTKKADDANAALREPNTAETEAAYEARRQAREARHKAEKAAAKKK